MANSNGVHDTDGTVSGPAGRRLSKTERRELLLDAALRVLREGGPSALTTRAVTRAAGMPHGAFRWCFTAKDDLLRALAERDARVPALSIEDAALAASDARQALRIYLLRYWESLEVDPSGQLGLTELELLTRRSHGPLSGHDEGYRRQVEAVLERIGAAHRLTWPDLPHGIADIIVATLRGITLQWLLSDDGDRAREEVRVLADLIATAASPRNPA